MEAGLGSRKRKRRSSKSDPFGGMLTRSKSQIYLRQHRSGVAIADFIRSRNLARSLKSTPKSEATVAHIATQVSVKDLRSRRVFSPTTIKDKVVGVGKVDLQADIDVHKTNDGNPNVSSSNDDDVSNDLGVSDSVANYTKPSPQTIENLPSVREDNVLEADEFVQTIPTVPEPDQNRGVGEKNDMVSVVDQIVDTKGSMSKSQTLVTSLPSRRKIFKSPSSFSYRRLLPYLTGEGKDDSSNFEIVEVTLPGKVQKSSIMSPNIVASKDEEIDAVSDSRKLADAACNNAKSCKKQYSNNVNPNLIRTIERLGLPDVVQKIHEDFLSNTLEECKQMTPPDSDIYSKSKVDEISGVLVKPTDASTVRISSTESNDSSSASKLVLEPCSRIKALQTPTSFSHRRLLPFLMSVAKDNSCASKVNQALKLEKDTEQNPQPSTFSLLHQNISMDETKTNCNSGQPSAAHEKSDSPTSTLIPVDASFDRMKTVTVVSCDNTFNTDGTDMVHNGSTSQLEVKLQAETVKFDSSQKLEQELPEKNSKCVEEANAKAISSCAPTRLESLHSICTEQYIDANSDFMDLRNSYSEDTRNPVSVSIHQSSSQMIPLNSPGIHGEIFRNGILKRTPRGCRGICNCLNCMSFRLHAERSFEFSRNQMHDAEEVALELIKDLICLRNILEGTASDCSYLASAKEEQVREACAKALHTEEVARMRLVQMNEDLNVHCRSTRLLRPKVSFSNKIEEKVISRNG